jgi:hypothetical protein
MVKNGFSTYSYDPFNRRLQNLGNQYSERGNTLFIRNINRVKKKVGGQWSFEMFRRNL